MDVDTEMESKPFEARQYQLDLLEYVTNNNGIIYLPTGAGKTYVAILALKRFSKEMDKTISNGGKRAIFMCNTVELARQQAQEMRKHINLKIGLYIGERDVDNWVPKKWNEEIEENQVLVGTAQIFLNIVTSNFIKMTDLSIVIIDECHHGTKSHPMHEFMRMYQLSQGKKLPRIIGLTGVLIKGNKISNITESLRNLEVTYHGNIVTVNSMEEFLNVLVHSTKPKEHLLLYGHNHYTPSVNDIILSKIGSCISKIHSFDIGAFPIKMSKSLGAIRQPNKVNVVSNLLKDIIYHVGEYGLYCTLFVVETIIIDLEMKARRSETIPLRRFYRFVITDLVSIQHLIFAKLKECVAKEELITNDDYHTPDIILNFSTTKVESLLTYIKKTFENKNPQDIKCLVFVERRLTANAICNVLRKFITSTPGLNKTLFPEFMVGRNSEGVQQVENILERRWNKQVLANFRNGTCNIIICSSVLEEGIDVQACNYVIAFDQLKTFNSYIQTKGRARTNDANFTIVASQRDKETVSSQILNYQKISTMIQNFLIDRIVLSNPPDADEISTQFTNEILPFKTSSGACLLASTALQLLHRYCQMLPWDAFGCVLPQFVKAENPPNKFRVSVNLPMQSRVKENIMSEPMDSLKMAKLSAAFKACEHLYKEGELNEKLLPISKRECVKNISSVLFQHWEKHKDSVINPKKEKYRLYEKKCPDEFYNAMPRIGETCFAYEIEFVPNFDRNEYNSHVVDVFKCKNNYALLLRKRLPRLASMPLFMRQGALQVKISDTPLEIIITNEEELQHLKNYHIMIMRDILKCWRSYYVQDSRNKENSFLIVPLTGGLIDWNIVRRFDKLKHLRGLSETERQNTVYNPQEWLHKIVAKWYTADTSERFIVTKVHTDKTPLSKFSEDDSRHETFLEFYESRYGSKVGRIVNRNQFLLEVKSLTTRRNFFNNAKSKDSEIKRDTQQIILLPELCHNFEHPGNLWLKALFLPSILHRLHFMLHAENLRCRINEFLGFKNSFTDYKPKPLIIDSSLRRAVDNDGNICDDRKDVPTLLPEISKKINSNESNAYEICELTGFHLWKPFMEPINISKCQYPIELQYYYNFSQGFEEKWNRLHSDTSEYSFCQLEMPTNYNNSKKLLPTSQSNSNPAIKFAIGDVPIEEKRRIRILERSSMSNCIARPEVLCAEQYEILAALTTSGANDVFDMERFELLGDSFLKFSISLFLMNKFPNWHEGFLTEVKSKLVSNRNLLYCLLETDIPERICSRLFLIHSWLPPLVSLPKNFLELLDNPKSRSLLAARDLYDIELTTQEIITGNSNDVHFIQFQSSLKRNEQIASDDPAREENSEINYCTYKNVCSNKNVADTLEALLGVCVKNYGIRHSFQMLEFFGLCKQEPGGLSLRNLLDLKFGGSLIHANIKSSEVDEFLINYQYLEGNLGYKFNDRAYLLQALTHPSFPTNRLTGCYQELEFLGDAILDFLISCYLFERHESKTPGMITDIRSALVNNITLGCICVRYRFHLFLLAENAVLAESIKTFAEYQETQEYRVTDQVHILIEENDIIRHINSDNKNKFNISTNVEVPKVLGDIVEALIAAVYLDSGSLSTTWNVIYNLLEQELVEFGNKAPIDPVRQLYEHPSAKPVFSAPTTDNGTTLVKCDFTCLNKSHTTHGFGVNKHQAKKSAAKHALQILIKSVM